MMKEQAKIRKTLNFLIRAVIIVATYGFIYRQVFLQRRPGEIMDHLTHSMDNRGNLALFIIILLLMLLNWGLESLKWQLLIRKIENLGFIKSFKAVLTGISISLFTPNRTGDYLGRVFILDKANHVEGILITIIGSFAQLIVTLCLGLFCMMAFLDLYLGVSYHVHQYLYTVLVFVVPSAVFILLLLYFKIGILTDFITSYFPGKWQRFIEHATVFSRYSSRELLWNLVLSMMRYIVFTTQFILLLRLFGLEIPVTQGIILIAVIYLLITLIPSIALAELGIRGSVSIYIFGLYFAKSGLHSSNSELAILAATTMLWFINLILPAMLGTLFVFNLKFFRK